MAPTQSLLLFFSITLEALQLCAAVPASAAAALVLDIQGHATPPLTAYHEIDLLTIQLAKKTRLTFLHYDTCRMVTVTGGAITFTPDTYVVDKGQITQDIQVGCPQRLRALGGITGVQLRSAAKSTIPLTPTFVLTGQRAQEFVALRVSHGATVIMDVPMHGRRVPWPMELAPLTAGQEYEIALIPAGSTVLPARVSVMVADVVSGVPPQSLVLLSVE